MSPLHLAQAGGALLVLTSLLGLAAAFAPVSLKRHELVLLAAQVLVGAVCWLLLEGPLEGRVLIAVSYDHGLAAADLVVLTPLTVVGLLVVRNSR